MIKYMLRLLFPLSVVVAILLASSAIAQADPATDTSQPTTSEDGSAAPEAEMKLPYCVQHLVPVSPVVARQGWGLSSVQEPEKCFSTAGAALADSTGDPSLANVSEATAGKYLRGEMPKTADGRLSARATNRPLGTDYVAEGYQPPYKTWSSTVNCSATNAFLITYVGSDWNDKISSASPNTGTGCKNWDHFVDLNLGGSYKNCGYGYIGGGGTCPNMGTFDNKTSSERFIG